MKKKPTPKDFNSPTITSTELYKELAELYAEGGGSKFLFILAGIIFFSVFILFFWGFSLDNPVSLDNPDTFLVSAGIAFIIAIFPTILVVFLGIKIESLLSNKEEVKRLKRKIEELEALVGNRVCYEDALEDWEYLNLVTKKGFWLDKRAIDLETAVEEILTKFDWTVKTTKTVGDGGIDLICEKRGERVLVQCKGHKSALGVSAIRDAAGVKMAHVPDAMVVIAPKGFTKGSRDFAEKSGIELISADQLTKIAGKSSDLINF